MFLNYLPKRLLKDLAESQIGDKKLSRPRVDLINLSLGIVLIYLCGLSLLRKILRRPGLVLLMGFIVVMLLGAINRWLGLIAAFTYFAGILFLIYFDAGPKK